MSASRRIQTGIGAALTAVGVLGTLAPQRLKAPGGSEFPAEATSYLTRLWTLREAALGATLLATRNSGSRRSVLGVFVALAAEVAAGLNA